MRVAKAGPLIFRFSPHMLKRELRFFNRASLIALLSAATYFIGSLMLNGVFGFDGTLAAQLAIVLSAAVSYMGHAWFTFSVEAANVQRIMRFVLSFVLTSLISWTVTAFLIPVLSLKYWQGLFIVAVVVPAFNYAFLRFSVFRLS